MGWGIESSDMQTIQLRLSLNYLIVLVLGMVFATVLAWQAVAGFYINTQGENLLAQARLIAAALESTTTLPNNAIPYSQASNILPGIHTRLLTEGGAVVVGLPLSDAYVQMPLAEDNASILTSDLVRRPEIASALQGTASTALRRVLDNRRVLYAAAPIYTENGEVLAIVYVATPLPATGLPTNILLQLIGAIILAVLLASLAGRYLARQIARPLEELANVAKRISGGDLNAQTPTDTDIAELHSLGQTFNGMAESLRQSDEAKKAFIADVTHELRTPLTVIKGTIETLEDGALDDHTGRGPLLTSMQRETDRLIRLVNELLVLTRTDAGSLQLDMQSIDLTELARSRCDILSGLATRNGIALKISKSERQSDLHVFADPDRLSQVLDNLLDNAFRHSPNGSTVTISVKAEESTIACSICDEGEGIPPEHLPFIFERFYRVDKSRDRNRGGTGLGLAIAHALVQAQGGTITAHSTVGKGTTVTFCLPRSHRDAEKK